MIFAYKNSLYHKIPISLLYFKEHNVLLLDSAMKSKEEIDKIIQEQKDYDTKVEEEIEAINNDESDIENAELEAELEALKNEAPDPVMGSGAFQKDMQDILSSIGEENVEEQSEEAAPEIQTVDSNTKKVQDDKDLEAMKAAGANLLQKASAVAEGEKVVKTEKQTKEPTAESKSPSNKSPTSFLSKETVNDGDDPMVALMKELFNFMLEHAAKFREQAEAIAKKVFEIVKNVVSPEKDKVDGIKQKIDSIEKNIKPITDNEKSAFEKLGLDKEKGASPAEISKASEGKLNGINSKIEDANKEMEAVGKQYKENSKKLSDDHRGGAITNDDYNKKFDELNNKFQEDQNKIQAKQAGYQKEYDEVRNASKSLENKAAAPQPQPTAAPAQPQPTAMAQPQPQPTAAAQAKVPPPVPTGPKPPTPEEKAAQPQALAQEQAQTPSTVQPTSLALSQVSDTMNNPGDEAAQSIETDEAIQVGNETQTESEVNEEVVQENVEVVENAEVKNEIKNDEEGAPSFN